jgi:hypothetical protein
MRRIALAGLVLLVTLAPVARGQSAPRQVRVANINVLLFGLGYASYDHPNFSDESFPSLTYQRRILRREARQFPLWLRGAATFLSENRKFYGYTIYRSDDEVPIQEQVSEHTSDFTVRFEGLVDLLHAANWAVYAGGGFGVHAITFNSDGADTGFPQFKATENDVGPSLAAGARLFLAERSGTIYGEVRYGKVYGRNDPSGGRPLTDQTLDFPSVDCISIEGGAGLHW